jgi:hypothetical protein
MVYLDSLISLKDGGVWIVPVLLLVLLTVGASMILGVLLAMGKRVPTVLLLLLPLVTIVIGVVGQAFGIWELERAVTTAPEEMVDTLRAGGQSIAQYPVLAALLPMSTVFGLLALAGAIGAFVHRLDEAKGSALHAAVPAFLGLLGVGLLLIVPTGSPGAVAALLALPLVSARSSDLPAERAWLAAARARVGVLAALSVAVLAWSSLLWGQVEAYKAVATAPPELRGTLMTGGVSLAWTALTWGLLATFVFAFAGVASVAALAKDAFSGRNLLGAALAALVLLALGGAFASGQLMLSDIEPPAAPEVDLDIEL